MRNTPISPDEHEQLEKMPLKEEKDPNFRLGKVQATLRNDYWEHDDAELVVRQRRGGVEFKVVGYHKIKTAETKRCNLGHEHEVTAHERFVYEAVELPREKAREFALWLLARTGGMRGATATNKRPSVRRNGRH